MAIRKIVLYAQDAATLRKKSRLVKGISRGVQRLVLDLKDTLVYSSDGIGLAAPQINLHWRIIVVHLGSRNEEGREPEPPIALINPKIIQASDEQKDFDGCLSFPGLYGETVRPHHLRVIGLDEQDKPFDCIYKDFDAVVVHHEIDHLNGVLFIDRVESIDDLYQVRIDENGQQIRIPVQAINII
jgi:peptide deformylase